MMLCSSFSDSNTRGVTPLRRASGGDPKGERWCPRGRFATTHIRRHSGGSPVWRRDSGDSPVRRHSGGWEWRQIWPIIDNTSEVGAAAATDPGGTRAAVVPWDGHDDDTFEVGAAATAEFYRCERWWRAPLARAMADPRGKVTVLGGTQQRWPPRRATTTSSEAAKAPLDASNKQLCIHIHSNINRFLQHRFQFMALVSIYCLFMIFLFTFYANIY
jgi:hypothetical protein